ncbi:iron chelate uptake ABC transporter family permease subunit [Tissierella carlieri]|uniref:Iron chelate uptake ABC transporter family permease subunit n=1 Tax=Tissierella carlieri TaxID=689904 RepID=A0ABT1SD43_9FIRM|nr:iron chelate uptake ABC transporter family permease subunit [Tissierella carlieri]MBU5310612.1 iron chelate uptake ABC transporter family permease subunit [Tissierella carlieri]MCQ4924307.1 iron chelate uptake ABC transporter family permease subunit [Tissierella carlieri]
MNSKKKIYFLSILLLILITLFLIIGLNSKNWQYALSRRIPKIIAIILTGSSIAFSSMIFQTITNNNILTPSVLGLDSLYMFFQTFIVFVFGSNNLAKIGNNFNFILSVVFMVIFSIILFKILFKKEGTDIFFLLLLGLVCGTFFQSLSSFMQVLIDPNEFSIVQNKMFASFNNVNTNILWLALVGIFLAIVYTYKNLNSLDVLSLGRDNAINLGVDYDGTVKKMLIVISILVSVSTALVGPITFLGLLVVNITREFFKTYKHKYLIIGSMLVSSIALVGGQLLAERVTNFSTPISVIINFAGGTYFIFLLLKESKI